MRTGHENLHAVHRRRPEQASPGGARLLAAADERQRGVRGRVARAARARRGRHEEDQAAARPQQPRGRVQQVPRALAWRVRPARRSDTLTKHPDPRPALPGQQCSAAQPLRARPHGARARGPPLRNQAGSSPDSRQDLPGQQGAAARPPHTGPRGVARRPLRAAPPGSWCGCAAPRLSQQPGSPHAVQVRKVQVRSASQDLIKRLAAARTKGVRLRRGDVRAAVLDARLRPRLGLAAARAHAVGRVSHHRIQHLRARAACAELSTLADPAGHGRRCRAPTRRVPWVQHTSSRLIAPTSLYGCHQTVRRHDLRLLTRGADLVHAPDQGTLCEGHPDQGTPG
jgi:hypothetical protein